MESNPLKQYFRQPAIYVRLPSQGQFYPPDAFDSTANNEYPVLPMTTLDEITYRTPDALFNGSAVTAVIQSCVPNIKNAWAMPSMDIDAVLVAIRIATYGHEMDISTTCPSCQSISDYSIDLRTVMDQLRTPDYRKPLETGDLQIFFKPMSYQQINDNSMTQFEEQKALQMMQDQTIEEKEKLDQISEMLKKITDITTKALAQNIAIVKTPGAQVSNFEHIREWLSNCDRSTFARIRDYIIDNKRQGELKPMSIRCSDCSHEYEQAFTLDMANFFADAS
jgi:hypothetical protein